MIIVFSLFFPCFFQCFSQRFFPAVFSQPENCENTGGNATISRNGKSNYKSKKAAKTLKISHNSKISKNNA
ncbi:MAG: hypothetical protein LUI87_14390 [Lachnospiraceae bacterium]|nr:hypothetical protein [Lachnospiraceae bacterium]